MKKLLLIVLLIVGCEKSTAPQDCAGVVDIDGNCYATVQIGEQLWMAENLKVIHYNNGDEIPTGLSFGRDGEWANTTEGAYAVYDDNPTNADIYGNLYNWAVIGDERGVCPDGFHTPSDDEYKELEMYLGMSQAESDSNYNRGTNEGSKLAGNVDLWNSGNLKENSEFGNSGFAAIPSGYRSTRFGTYNNIGNDVIFYSSTEGHNSCAYTRGLAYDSTNVSRHCYSKKHGASVRCLKD